MVSRRMGARASVAVAALSLMSFAVGILLISMLGGVTGQDLGAAASAKYWARAVPFLIIAEVLKLVTAAAQAVVVGATVAGTSSSTQRTFLLVTGLLGALGIAASGIAGFYAIAVSEATAMVRQVGFWGLASTGVWAILLVLFKPLRLSSTTRVAALAFGLACIGALLVPPLALATVFIGLIFWFGLAFQLRVEA